MGLKRKRRVALAVLGLLLPVACSQAEEEWKESPFLIERGNPRLSASPSGSAGAQGISLQGILWDPRSPAAVINNQVVGVGDRTGAGWEVIEIQQTQVTLSDGSSEQKLSLE